MIATESATPGIYFLLSKGAIIYVWHTKNLSNRLNAYHTCKGKYDSVRFIACHPEKMKEYEARWIGRFKPKYNKYLNPDRPIKFRAYVSVGLRMDSTLANIIKESAIKSKRSFNREIEYVLTQKYMPRV